MNDASKSFAHLLNEFVLAREEDSDGALERLFDRRIEPLASAVIGHRLRVSMRSDDQSHINQTALDLLSGVKSALLPLLRRMRAGSHTDAIENFDAYVRTAALNAYRQFLRDKYPNRLRLRNKLRYIITRRPTFAMWIDSGGTAICGLSGWADSQMSPLTATGLEELETKPPRLSPTMPDREMNAQLVGMIANIFERAEAPLIFEDLVALIWRALGLREAQAVSESERAFDVLSSKEQNIEQQFDDRALVEHIWSRIGLMPLRHRRALLLNLRDDKGGDLLSLFPILRIASIREIAAKLEYEPEELAALWSKLPLDDLAIAERMGLTRQQVINLRQSARAGLRKELQSDR